MRFRSVAVHYRIDYIFNTDDTASRSKKFFNKGIVSDWESLFFFLDTTSLPDQVINQLLGRIAESDIVLDLQESFNDIWRRMEENNIVDLF